MVASGTVRFRPLLSPAVVPDRVTRSPYEHVMTSAGTRGAELDAAGSVRLVRDLYDESVVLFLNPTSVAVDGLDSHQIVDITLDAMWCERRISSYRWIPTRREEGGKITGHRRCQ